MPSENAQSLHKSCRDPAECSANLEVAICNLKHSASWKIQGVVIPNEVRDLHFAARLTKERLAPNSERRAEFHSRCSVLSRGARRQDLFHVDLGWVISRIAGGAVSRLFSIRASFLKTF